MMPAHTRRMFTEDELKTAELGDGFEFTQGCTLLKDEAGVWDNRDSFSMSGYAESDGLYTSYLFDLKEDTYQLNPIKNRKIEEKMIRYMKVLMVSNGCPVEQFTRMGLD